jgi:hypothetical protein
VFLRTGRTSCFSRGEGRGHCRSPQSAPCPVGSPGRALRPPQNRQMAERVELRR